MSLSESAILIVSTALDSATDAVAKQISESGHPFIRLDTEQYPFNLNLSTVCSNNSQTPQLLVHDTTTKNEHSISSIWYRRVRAPRKPLEMNSGVYDFCMREGRAALLGTTLAFNVPIMSSPECVWAAEQKIYQLSLAKRIGLKIPETIVTNNPSTIRDAYNRFNGDMIAKPVRTGFVDYGDEQHAIYTSLVQKKHLENLDGARFSPTILQPLIKKMFDVRVTYVDGFFFTAEIESQSDSSSQVDWRKTSNPELPHRKANLPDKIQTQLKTFMEVLDLKFGAIDLIRTPENEYIFLEVNPNGQWLWLDSMLDFGITSAIAEWLITSSTQNAHK